MQGGVTCGTWGTGTSVPGRAGAESGFKLCDSRLFSPIFPACRNAELRQPAGLAFGPLALHFIWKGVKERYTVFKVNRRRLIVFLLVARHFALSSSISKSPKENNDLPTLFLIMDSSCSAMISVLASWVYTYEAPPSKQANLVVRPSLLMKVRTIASAGDAGRILPCAKGPPGWGGQSSRSRILIFLMDSPYPLTILLIRTVSLPNQFYRFFRRFTWNMAFVPSPSGRTCTVHSLMQNRQSLIEPIFEFRSYQAGWRSPALLRTKWYQEPFLGHQYSFIAERRVISGKKRLRRCKLVPC